MSLVSLEDELNLLITAVQNNRLTAYFEIISIAVLVYDYFLTFKFEVGLVWGTPWTLGKILFFMTRYSVFIDCSLLGFLHLSGGKSSVQLCYVLYQISGWMIFLGVAIAEFVLIFRTWAIWGQSRKVAIGLLVFLFSVGTPSMYLTYHILNSVIYIESPIPLIQRCFLVKINDKSTFWNYVVILFVETVILIFTLIKGVHHYRHSKSDLIVTLYQDGLLYYVYLTACTITNVVVISLPNKTHGTSLILLERVLHSIFTARILLHIRLAGVRDRRDVTTTSSTPAVLTSLFIHYEDFSTSILGTHTWFYSREMDHSNTFELTSYRGDPHTA